MEAIVDIGDYIMNIGTWDETSFVCVKLESVMPEAKISRLEDQPKRIIYWKYLELIRTNAIIKLNISLH